MNENTLNKVNSIIITFVFCTAIFTPFIIGIYEKDKTTSKVENRNLSQVPSRPTNIKAIKAFPKLFENYYSDHFGLRNQFARYYKMVKYGIGDSPSEDVTLGKNGWLFLGSIKKGYKNYSDPFGGARNVNLFSDHELKSAVEYLEGLNSFLNEKGIKYLFVIAPNKHTIYFDQLPDYISKVNEKSAIDQLVEYIEKFTNVPIVDLRKSLLKEKEQKDLYYRNDTHWNHNGANIAQYEIMKKIDQLFPGKIKPELATLKGGMRNSGDLVSFIGIDGFKEEDPQPVFKNQCEPTLLSIKTDLKAPKIFTCHDQNLNAVIFRDSFFTALQPYFIRKLKRSTYIWDHLKYSTLKNYFDSEKPDIIIEERIERDIPYLPKDPNIISILNKTIFYSSQELIFSKDSKKLNFNKHLSVIDDSKGILRLKATGNDPSIYFPLLPFKQNNKYILYINMISSVQSILQIFYSDITRTGFQFSEENSISYDIKKGENDIYIVLEFPKIGKHLRLDPISGNGKIKIKSLDIKRVDVSDIK